jgi:very-short-patch-repair endonuclease
MGLQQKCLNLWKKTHGKNIRRDTSYFSKQEKTEICEKTSWLKNDNFTTRVFCIAFNIENFKCNFSGKKLNDLLVDKILYKMSPEQIKSFLFRYQKIKEKISPDFSLINDHTAKYCETHCIKTILRTPYAVNQCFFNLDKRGFDIKLIESNEEAVFLDKKNYTEFPKCPVTNEKLKFNKSNFKYLNYSNKQISNNNPIKSKKLSKAISKALQEHPEIHLKREQTNIERYGVPYPFLLPDVLEKALVTRRTNAKIKKEIQKKIKEQDKRTRLEKYVDTCITKYGQDYNKVFANRVSTEKRKKAAEKAKKTFIEKYGVDNPNKCAHIKEKRAQTCFEKYGVTSPLARPEIQQRTHTQARIKTFYNFARFKHISIPCFTLEKWLTDYDKRLKWQNVETGKYFMAKYWGSPPIGSLKQTTLEQHIAKLLKKLNVKVETHRRDILDGLELDFFLEKEKIAIECNGEYWHSVLNDRIDKNYHLNKLNLCNTQNIKLLQFWGEQIMTKKQIIYHIIKKAIKKTTPYKIGARKCNIKYINSKAARKFLEKYHLEGFVASSCYLGAFYKERLVSVMSFSNNRFINENKFHYEITRFASIFSFTIIGIVNKFINFFTTHYDCNQITTYANKMCFDGRVYLYAGFNKEKDTPPSYFYYKQNKKVLTRYQCQKHKLKNILENFDPTKTELENMELHKYYRVYDCGHAKYVKYFQ